MGCEDNPGTEHLLEGCGCSRIGGLLRPPSPPVLLALAAGILAPRSLSLLSEKAPEDPPPLSPKSSPVGFGAGGMYRPAVGTSPPLHP